MEYNTNNAVVRYLYTHYLDIIHLWLINWIPNKMFCMDGKGNEIAYKHVADIDKICITNTFIERLQKYTNMPVWRATEQNIQTKIRMKALITARR